MRLYTPDLLTLRAGHPVADAPHVFVETGTFQGRTTALALQFFAEVHTIELSVVHHLKAWTKFWDHSHVHCHYGDSAKVLPALCSQILPPTPVMFYLDAHWFGARDAVGKGELPLWAEIKAIADRGCQDTIVVDDVASFGTDHPEPVWLDVTMDTIMQAIASAGREGEPWSRKGCDQVAVFLA